MKANPLLKARDLGQSLWLDYIQRGLIESGELKRLMEKDGIRGVTSNPSIFDKAIGGSRDYDEAIARLAREGKDAKALYEALTVEDVARAADVFRPLFDESEGRHGFVSLEVNPRLAHDTEETLREARRLWGELNRANVFIKVPATLEGLPAIERLIREGINVNVTLLFGLSRYRQVADAFIRGLEGRLRDGRTLDRVASVASFFLSRIDAKIDPWLEEIRKKEGEGEKGRLAQRLHGEVAIASARRAYEIYKDVFHGDRFRPLADRGARTQRVLWASTSTKNPEYADVKYVEALIGPETINTLPKETLDAYRDHGDPKARLEEDLDKAGEVLDSLPRLGIDLDEATRRLEAEGVDKFILPFDNLMKTLERQGAAALPNRTGARAER